MFVHSQLVYVSLAHRYWNTLWTVAENRKVYGTSASCEGLGSNLKVVLGRKSVEAKELDFEESLRRLKALADHRCLFTEFTEFGSVASTLERITLWLARELNSPESEDWAYLEVHETDQLACRLESGLDRLEIVQKVGNLTLAVRGSVDESSGLVLPRDLLPQAVEEVFPLFEARFSSESEWANQLFAELRRRVPQLTSLSIDLGRQKSWRVSDS